MFGRSQYNKIPFNASGTGDASLYVTVQTEYGVSVQPLRIKVRIDPTRMDAASAFSVGRLWLFLPLPAVCMEAECDVIPNFTARVPLGRIGFPMESEVSLVLRALMPLGRTAMAAAFSVLPTLWVKMLLPAMSVKTELGMRPRLGVLVPVTGVAFGTEFGIRARLGAYMPLNALVIESEYGGSVKNVRASESEEMVLKGLDLRPGQRLIIDTDTLEVSVDDEIRVDCWVTGGTFFQLKKGSNTLSFSDNASRRKLKTTVLWADRYL